MKWRNTWLLAAAAVLVIALAYRDIASNDPGAGWEIVFDEPEPTPPAVDVVRLVEFDPRSVVALRVERAGKSIEVRRTAYGWRNTERPRAVSDLLDSIADMAVILEIDGEPDDDDLDAYGLDNPQAVISIEREALPPIEIRLGNHNPSATGIYARISQRPHVVLTGAVAIWDIEKAIAVLAPAEGS